MRNSSAGCSSRKSRNVACIASAARTARSASSSCAIGAPNKRHDRVAEHLVDHTAVGLDVGDQQREGGVDEALHLLGVAPLGDRGEADDVREQHGDDAPLLVGDRLGNGHAARAACRSSGRSERLRGPAASTLDTPSEAPSVACAGSRSGLGNGASRQPGFARGRRPTRHNGYE